MDSARLDDNKKDVTMPWLYCQCGVCCVLHMSEAPDSEGRLFYKCPGLNKEMSCDVNIWVSDIAAKYGLPMDTPIVPPRAKGHRRLVPDGVELASGDMLCAAEDRALAELPATVLIAGSKRSVDEAGFDSPPADAPRKVARLDSPVQEEEAVEPVPSPVEVVPEVAVKAASEVGSVSTTYDEIFEDYKVPVTDDVFLHLKTLPEIVEHGSSITAVSSDAVAVLKQVPDLVGSLSKRVLSLERKLKKAREEASMYRAIVENGGL